MVIDSQHVVEVSESLLTSAKRLSVGLLQQRARIVAVPAAGFSYLIG